MPIRPPIDIHLPALVPTPEHIAALDRLGDQIAELSAHLDAASARLLDLIREFDARGGWNTGFSSCAAWLTWRVGLEPGAARERVRVARALATLPRLARALARGQLSYAKVRALTRVATPETEERLLSVGLSGTAAHVERIVRGWRWVDRRAEVRDTARQHARRGLHLSEDDDGSVIVRGRLTPEVGTLLRRALDAARETLYQQHRRSERHAAAASACHGHAETLDRQQPGSGTATGPSADSPPTAARPTEPLAPSAASPEPVASPVGDPPTLAQQRADALALLAESALHHDLDPGASGERYQVVVHVDAPVLANPEHPGQSVLEDGARVSAEPIMWLSPLPVLSETRYAHARGARGRRALLVP